jgi:hypothetical protein
MVRLPEEIKPAMQGAVPATMATCSKNAVPNATVISQVFWVDHEHVALSFQFFNKTIKNVRENPHASVDVLDPSSFTLWSLDLDYDRSETAGPVFDAMDIQLEAIASMQGMSGVFKLRAADIYRVRDVRKMPLLDG